MRLMITKANLAVALLCALLLRVAYLELQARHVVEAEYSAYDEFHSYLREVRGDVPPRVDHRVEIEAAVSLGKRSSGDLLLFVNAVDPFSVSAQGCDQDRHALVAA